MSMLRFALGGVLFTATLVVVGCGGEDDTPTGPPPTSSITETFTETLTRNGGRVHTFSVTATGGISALLVTLSPDSTHAVGLSLGTWNGSICQIILDNPAAIQGSVVVGQTSAVGEFCVRIYDATGTLPRPQTYAIEVTHQVASQ